MRNKWCVTYAKVFSSQLMSIVNRYYKIAQYLASGMYSKGMVSKKRHYVVMNKRVYYITCFAVLLYVILELYDGES